LLFAKIARFLFSNMLVNKKKRQRSTPTITHTQKKKRD